MSLRKPRNADQVTPPQRRPPASKVPDIPVVGIESPDQLAELRPRIGPQAGDNAVERADDGQRGRQIGPEQPGPAPGANERHRGERAQPGQGDNPDLERGAARNLKHADALPPPHGIGEDSSRLDGPEMVERREDRAESIELRGHRPRVYSNNVVTVRIEVREYNRHADLSGQGTPWATRAGTEIDDPVRPGPRERATE